MKRNNRETWLNKMAKELKRLVFTPAGIKLNLRKVKISVGYPPKGGAAKKNKSIGVCFARVCSDANVNEIFINPCMDKDQVTQVAGVLVHELIHAIEDCKGHGPSFRKMALACGLTGKMTATTETDELKATIKTIEKKIGKYPHKKLNYEIGRKKQSTRNLKIECPKCTDIDPYFVRMSKTMYEKGAPSCGVCGTTMTHDIIGATIKDIRVASVDTDFTPKEQALLFEVAIIANAGCANWMTDLLGDNYSWFTGQEIMNALNWSKEKVGGVMASLVEKKAIVTETGIYCNGRFLIKELSELNISGTYNKETNNYDSDGTCKVFDLFRQWEATYPEPCANPYKEGGDK